MSPFQTIFRTAPDYNSLKVFGCACFPFLRPYNKHKFDFHTSKCFFLGYSDSHKGFKCLHPSGRLYIFRYVTFNEHEFPYKSLFSVSNSNPDTSNESSLPVDVLSSARELSTCHRKNQNSSSLQHHSLATIPIVPFSIELPHSIAHNSPNTVPVLSKHNMLTRSKTASMMPRAFVTLALTNHFREATKVVNALSDPCWK